MFRGVLSGGRGRAVAAGAAAVVAGSFLNFSDAKKETISECSDTTIVGLLQGISRKVSNIEKVLGSIDQKPPPTKKHGIDIVLGAQWGDEGKGKLVDMLSQVGGAYTITRSCFV